MRVASEAAEFGLALFPTIALQGLRKWFMRAGSPFDKLRDRVVGGNNITDRRPVRVTSHHFRALSLSKGSHYMPPAHPE